MTIRLNRESSQKLIRVKENKWKGDFLLLNIQDTGQGMNQSILDHIFDPFLSGE